MKINKRPNGHAILANLTLDNKGVQKIFNAAPANEKQANNKLFIYDVIDQYWGVSAQMVVEALDTFDRSMPTDVHLNSPGGSVFEARAIITNLRQHGEFNTYVDGVAASAASWIATSGKNVTMAKGSFLMIHQSWGGAFGNAKDMRATANLLEKIDGTIIDEYVAKTGLPRDELERMLEDETWFTADEAKAANFIDVVDDSEEASNMWNMKGAYKNAPEPVAPPEDEFDWEAANRRVAVLMLNENKFR